MSRLRVSFIGFILVLGFGLYYYSLIVPSPILTSFGTQSTSLPTLKYKLVEMNDRLPFFKLASNYHRTPYADGDRAQATVIRSLQLVDKCKQDPSLIVVDVGALLGTHSSYFNKHMI